LTLETGPFRVGISSSISAFTDTLGFFYRDVVSSDTEQVLDYAVGLHRPRGARAWVRPQVVFEIDRLRPFDPQPLANAFPVFEWGLNWCIATSAHRYMMLHAGTVAFDDRAMILPGMPGSGKSTLSAALHIAGARLLSDEFGLVRPETVELLPLPRGIPLKNASIEAIIAFDPAAALGPTYPNTRKGRVRHLRPSPESLHHQDRPATPRWLVFPKYAPGAAAALRPLAKTEAFRQLAFNCFNYTLLGEQGFRAVARIIRQVDCYTFSFGDLESAVPVLQSLAADAPRSVEGRGAS
jgi:HprK-related kinase A